MKSTLYFQENFRKAGNVFHFIIFKICEKRLARYVFFFAKILLEIGAYLKVCVSVSFHT